MRIPKVLSFIKSTMRGDIKNAQICGFNKYAQNLTNEREKN
jgi:hypothetical protein